MSRFGPKISPGHGFLEPWSDCPSDNLNIRLHLMARYSTAKSRTTQFEIGATGRSSGTLLLLRKNIMALKLYGHPMSSCTARVMTCLVEKKVEFELVPVDLFSGQHKTPDFLAKNPFGLIPVLEDGDFILFESRAITEYICKKYAGNGSEDLLLSDDIHQSTRVRAWVEVESHYFQPAMSPIIYQSYVVPLLGNSPDEKVIEESLEKLKKVLDIYEDRLGVTKYLAGDSYSLADLHHLPYIFYFMKIEQVSAQVFDERPRVKAWWEDISSRAAFKEVSEGMKLEK